MRQFMDEPEVPTESEVGVCPRLRTKTAFGAQVGHADWRSGDSSTATYWCLETMQTFGPDGGVAHAHACRAGRKCFQAEQE